MGKIKILYYSVRKDRGFWLATKRMQAMGFPSSVPCGPDGPDAWKIAQDVGACIHAPPPPANKLVVVTTERPWPGDQLWD
jgi:uncharacterized protein